LWKNVYEYNMNDALNDMGVHLFHTPSRGEMYLHPLPDGGFYKMVFVADENWDRIVYGRTKYDASGNPVLNTSFLWAYDGKNGPGDGPLRIPRGLAVTYHDADHVVVYVADTGNNRICKLIINVHNGNVENRYDFYANSHGGLSYPYDVAINHLNNSDPNDDYLLIVDHDNHRLVEMNSNGEVIQTWGSKGSGWMQFIYPNAITFQRYLNTIQDKGLYDGYFQFYVSDFGNNRIAQMVIYRQGGNDYILIADYYQFPDSTQIFDISSDLTSWCLYALDRLNNKIYKFLLNYLPLKKVGEFGSYGKGTYQLFAPLSLSLASSLNINGNLWGGYYGGIVEWWSMETGTKYFEEGVDILDLQVRVNAEATLMNYSYRIPSGIGYRTEKIKNSSGKFVKTLINNVYTAGIDIITGTWDRRNDAGQLLPYESYTLEVKFKSFWQFSDGSSLDEITKSIQFNMSFPLTVEISGPSLLQSGQTGTSPPIPQAAVAFMSIIVGGSATMRARCCRYLPNSFSPMPRHRATGLRLLLPEDSKPSSAGIPGISP